MSIEIKSLIMFGVLAFLALEIWGITSASDWFIEKETPTIIVMLCFVFVGTLEFCALLKLTTYLI